MLFEPCPRFSRHSLQLLHPQTTPQKAAARRSREVDRVVLVRADHDEAERFGWVVWAITTLDGWLVRSAAPKAAVRRAAMAAAFLRRRSRPIGRSSRGNAECGVGAALFFGVACSGRW